MHPIRSMRGQASVELVAVLPLLTALCAAVLQAVLVGHAAWATASAARAATRASAVGTGASAAARAALPAHLARGLRVRALEGGRVAVSVRVPSLVPALDLGRISAEASFPEQS